MTPIHRFRDFKFPGPVAQSFALDRTNQIRALLGPQGGGKSVTCVFDLLQNASRMPVCTDGKIHFKVAIIRDTYGRLEQTTIPTWLQWIPKDGGSWTEAEFVGGGGRQATHTIRFDVLRGGNRVEVEFQAIFAAIGDQAAEDFMRGFEVTAFWLNEMDLLPEDVLTLGIGRIGRYPSIDMLPKTTPLNGFPGYTLGNLPPGMSYQQLPTGALYRDFIIGDLNAPDIDSWFYQRFEENPVDGQKLYKQPGGRSPLAENLHNLKAGYYADQVRLNATKLKWIRRFVDAQYGPSDDGQPVFPEYSDELFLAAEELKAVPGIPLEAGVDAGLGNPAAVIGQQMPNGQFRNLGEVVPGRMSCRRFAEEVKREVAAIAQVSGLPYLKLEFAWGDPAGWDGADKEDGQLAWMEELSLLLEIPIEPAPSNALTLRLDAVRDELVVEGGFPRTLISRRCRKLRKGYASHYCYKVDKKTNTPAADAKPHKGPYSHVADADQYWKLGKKGRYGTMAPRSASDTRRLGAQSDRNRSTVIRSNVLSGR